LKKKFGKFFSGETKHGHGPWVKRYMHAASVAQAKRNFRLQHNKENGRIPYAFVEVENVREEKT